MVMKPSDKVMFEIYREGGYNRKYRVVFFTELNEHDKEAEINRALAGEHFLDGFLDGSSRGEAKLAIQSVLTRLNRGESLCPGDVARELAEYLVE